MTFAKKLDQNLNIVQLIYCSQVRSRKNKKIFERDIGDILIQSRICNPLYDITSALLSDGKFFAHVIEGPPNSVTKLYSNIVYDQRHDNVILLQYTVVNVRLFYHWRMAYVEIDRLSHVDKLNIQSTPADLRKARISILKSFRPIFLDDT